MYCGPASADLSSILYSYINNTGLRTLQNAIKSEIPAQFLKALHTHIGVFSAQGLDGAWLASLRLPCVTYVHLLRSCNGATCSCVSSAICRHSFALTLFWQHVGVNHRNSKHLLRVRTRRKTLKSKFWAYMYAPGLTDSGLPGYKIKYMAQADDE